MNLQQYVYENKVDDYGRANIHYEEVYQQSSQGTKCRLMTDIIL